MRFHCATAKKKLKSRLEIHPLGFTPISVYQIKPRRRERRKPGNNVKSDIIRRVVVGSTPLNDMIYDIHTQARDHVQINGTREFNNLWFNVAEVESNSVCRFPFRLLLKTMSKTYKNKLSGDQAHFSKWKGKCKARLPEAQEAKVIQETPPETEEPPSPEPAPKRSRISMLGRVRQPLGARKHNSCVFRNHLALEIAA